MKYKSVLIVGATSLIAHQTARYFARNGVALVLAGRNQQHLNDIAADVTVYGAAKVQTLDFDATNVSLNFVTTAASLVGGIDAILIAHGSLPDNEYCAANQEQTLKEFTINATSVIQILCQAAQYFEQKQSGCIAVISSVAGDRGRQSNYLYGAAKSAVNTYAQGLRNRLVRANIPVVTIKPGFVDTPMTAHLPKNFLFASADTVGKHIYNAMIRGDDIIYTPFFWRYIMAAIRSIPEFMFKVMKL